MSTTHPTTKQLIRAFKARGGKTTHVPRGVTSNVKYKSFFKLARAYSHRTQEIRWLRSDAAAHGGARVGDRRGPNPTAPVDIFMQHTLRSG